MSNLLNMSDHGLKTNLLLCSKTTGAPQGSVLGPLQFWQHIKSLDKFLDWMKFISDVSGE